MGEFKPLNANLGVVAVYPHPDRGPFKEFCTLTHELGHARSWIAGTRSAEYEAVYNVPNPEMLSVAEKQLIIDEEMRAWQHGYTVAQEVGFTDKETYVAEATSALQWYFNRLNLPAQVFTLATEATE